MNISFGKITMFRHWIYDFIYEYLDELNVKL